MERGLDSPVLGRAARLQASSFRLGQSRYRCAEENCRPASTRHVRVAGGKARAASNHRRPQRRTNLEVLKIFLLLLRPPPALGHQTTCRPNVGACYTLYPVPNRFLTVGRCNKFGTVPGEADNLAPYVS